MSHLNAAQTEQLKQIGAELSEYRQQIKISLDEIAVKTYIPMRVLVAIEKANVKQLPEAVFVQGFIRRYADALGLNGRLIADRLDIDTDTFEIEPTASLADLPTPKAFVNKAGSIEVPTKSAFANPATPTANSRSSQGTTKLKFLTRKPLAKTLRYALTAVAGVGIAAIASLLVPRLLPSAESTAEKPVINLPNQALQRKTQTAPKATTVEKDQIPGSKLQAPPSKVANQTEKTTIASQPKASKAADIKAVVSVNDNSWISVKVDGEPNYEGVASKGFKKTWNAKQNIVLTAGNAGAVTVAFNNQKPQSLGNAGEVKEFLISANGVQPQ